MLWVVLPRSSINGRFTSTANILAMLNRTRHAEVPLVALSEWQRRDLSEDTAVKASLSSNKMSHYCKYWEFIWVKVHNTSRVWEQVMSTQWTVGGGGGGGWTMHQPGSGRPKTQGAFHNQRWRRSFPACRPKGRRGLWGGAAETTSHFIRFKGDRFRIKTGLEHDTGSRPHTSSG